MSQDQIWQWIRYVLLLGGGYLINKGQVSEEQWQSIVGGLGAVFAVAWGVYVRWNTKAVPTPVVNRQDLPVASSLTGITGKVK
jgi:hypothetical protein